jgi:hypothetical protein
MSTTAESTSIFSRVIEPESGTMSPELARYVMDLDFKPQDHIRFEHLSEKAQLGTLTPEEADELDGFLQVDSILSIMRSKAAQFLRP